MHYSLTKEGVDCVGAGKCEIEGHSVEGPTENREVVEMRDAVDAGRRGELSTGTCWGMEPVWCEGEAGGGGEIGGDGDLFGGDGMGSNCDSGGACANRRDKEEGRTGGDEVERERTGKRCRFGECVVKKESSTSASGGPEGSAGVAGSKRADWGCSLDTFRDETLRLFCWLG
jgi:hypothetical protein